MSIRIRGAMVLLGASLFSLPAFAATLATVNGKAITDSDLEAALSGVNEGQRQTYLGDKENKMAFLEQMIDQEVLFQEASKSKLKESQKYKQAIRQFQKQLLANLLVEETVGPKLTESAAKKYYEDNKSQFSTTQVHVHHILLENRKDAESVLNQVKKAGVDFQEIAEKNSKDPSAKLNRGDIGFIDRDRFVPEFTDTVFAAKQGEIVGPIKTAFGYHVAKVVERKVGRPLEYSEVELKVKAGLRQQELLKYVTQLRSKSKVSVKK